jgi:pyruvate dehydrogenase E1 component alpha subunit
MYRIRSVELEISKRYSEGKMRCPVHLSVGQEAVPSAFSEIVSKNDFAVSSHRGHAHYLGKGGNLKTMIAEIYGKKTGCSKGKGGSMHLIDLSVNFMGTSAIVGNSIPMGVGLGLSAKVKKTKQVSFIFFGDGAIEEGVFYESINFATLKKLPVVFICENNFYSVYSPLAVRQPPGRSISKMVKGIGPKVLKCDGNDIISVYNNLKKATTEVRKGNGQFFLEFFTYRWLEHCGPNYDNNIGYRTEDEFRKWKKKDPINRLVKKFDNKSYNQIKKINRSVNKEIKEAFDFAEKSPFPHQSEAYKGVYA